MNFRQWLGAKMIFNSEVMDEGYWFRLFGYGVSIIKDDGTRLFSERYGYRKVWHIFNRKIIWLVP